jgi:hypothetical protein
MEAEEQKGAKDEGGIEQEVTRKRREERLR